MKALTVIIASLCFLSLTAAVFAVKFTFDDKTQLRDWKVVTGKGEIKKVDGETALVISEVNPHPGWDHGAGLIWEYKGSEKWTDYVLQVKMRMIEAKAGPGKGAGTGAPGPIVRYQDNDNWYYIECYSGQAIFRPHVGGADKGWVKTGAVPGGFPDTPEWWDIRVEVSGANIKVDVDGKNVIDHNQPDIKAGKIGLTGWPGDTVAYNDLEVTGSGIPKTWAVDKQGKIATTWGDIKGMQALLSIL